MTVTSLIALLVGMFIIFNTFSISVNQRWKEIGVLRAIGVERKNVQRMFLGEAAVMGSIGSALGVVLGFGLSVGVEFVMSSIADQIFGLVSTRTGAGLPMGLRFVVVRAGRRGLDSRRAGASARRVTTRSGDGAAQH